jgi:hypothetical protein
MTVKLSCVCGQHIEVNRSAAGQKFRCPSCDILLAVPTVPITPRKNEANETVTSLQLTKRKLKQAIIISVTMVVGGVFLGITGLRIRKVSVLTTGVVAMLFGMVWLWAVRSQIRRNHLMK